MISVWEFFPLLEDFVPIAVCETKAEGDAIVAKRAALYPGSRYPGAVIVEREVQFMERLRGIGHQTDITCRGLPVHLWRDNNG